MKNQLPNGVMLNAYPDSIGERLSDMITVLKKPEFKDVFSLFYVLPTFFNSDLDRGFSVIDYNINEELISHEDLKELDKLNILLKFDLVLNHLSVGSMQFKDLLKYGDKSEYKDFFIDWNEYWKDDSGISPEGHMIPSQENLDKLFMRKPGLPILKVRFPDGSDRFYWNTFYQKVSYDPVSAYDFEPIVSKDQAEIIAIKINQAIEADEDISKIDFGNLTLYQEKIIAIVENNRTYLGQMDLNARSEKVWSFYEETLDKLSGFGAKILRLDAFAYLHKEIGMTNFFNRPGTWNYLDRLKLIAEDCGLILLPEIHSEYGTGIHEELSERGFPVYDFFFPGLLIDALDSGHNQHLLRWMQDIKDQNLKTVNMLGCHDGIPVIDLRGGIHNGKDRPGLLADDRIETIIERLLERGGRVKNLYGPDGKKISYYQVNATFFSALGEDESRMRLARAIQLFMPGTPQIWYLDLFAGTNDYEAADRAGSGGHKEINRTNLSLSEIEKGLTRSIVKDQLDMIRLRNTSTAFSGQLTLEPSKAHELKLTWINQDASASLTADLVSSSFMITHRVGQEEETLSFTSVKV